MLDTPVEILTDWREGGKRLERGDLHGLPFENKGKITRFDPPETLEYTHWSTLSILPDTPGNYSIARFNLQESQNETLLVLTIENLLTFEIFKHLEFYWKTALHLLKEVAESR
ncbi:Activator of Hsp90 ATPase homolog 1-like protein [Dyadobacter sp. SG02]|nr:Activator of Hsp90 ATPase homolog 1-like protein [Dyadobacter sp. SG02]